MSQGIVPLNQAQMPAAMAQRMAQQAAHNSNFAEGLRDSFPTISIKGKAFTFKQGQQVQQLVDQNGYALPFLDVILIDGSKYINKVYYEKGYTDGDADAPDCWSLDSIRPDASVQKKQNPVCGTCRWNQFGSRITPAGKQAKACSDSRRIAVVMPHHLNQPEPIIPMMRIPQSSLKALKQYAENLARNGWDVNGCLTRLSFDPAEAFPKLRFEFAGGLDDASYARAVALTEDPSVASMLSAPLADAQDDEGSGHPQIPPGPNMPQQAPAQYASAPTVAAQVHPAYAGTAPTAEQAIFNPQPAMAVPQQAPVYSPPAGFAPQAPAPAPQVVVPQSAPVAVGNVPHQGAPSAPQQVVVPQAQPAAPAPAPQQAPDQGVPAASGQPPVQQVMVPQAQTTAPEGSQDAAQQPTPVPAAPAVTPTGPAGPAQVAEGVIALPTGQFYSPALGSFCNPDGTALGHVSAAANQPATPAPQPVQQEMFANHPDINNGMTAAQAEQVQTWKPGDPVPGHEAAPAEPKKRKPRTTTPTPAANDTAEAAPEVSAAPPALESILAGLLPRGQ